MCDDLATQFDNQIPMGWDPCHGADYDFLMESITKVTESINKHSPLEKFDIAIECLWTFLHPLREYENILESNEYKELGFIHSMDELLTGLEEIIKLWAERHKDIEQEIWDLENWCGDNDWDSFYGHLVELYWNKRRATRRRMTVMSKIMKRNQTVMANE